MYTPSRHVLTFFVAGVQYHDAALVFDHMHIGTPVEMKAEHDNPFDPSAMALYVDGTMIGYVPAEDNGLFSALDFYGHTNIFEAHIIQVNPEADPWEQIRVGIYITDAR